MHLPYKKPQIKVKQYKTVSNVMDSTSIANVVYDAGAAGQVQYTLGTLDLNQ